MKERLHLDMALACPFNTGLLRSLAGVLHKIRVLLSHSEEDIRVMSGLWADFLLCLSLEAGQGR